MRNLIVTLPLALATFFASTGMGQALPRCDGSPLVGSREIKKATLAWNNCGGSVKTFERASLPNGAVIMEYYTIGAWKNSRLNGWGSVSLGENMSEKLGRRRE